jgi:YesN/AraC family two-component response regulator
MGNLMIVEEEIHLARMLEKVLNEELSNLYPKRFVCTSYDQALEISSSNRIDVLVISLTLPKREGLNFYRRLQKINPEITSMIMSDHQDFHLLHEAMELGIRKYFLKPVQPRKLVEELKGLELPKNLSEKGQVSSGIIKDAIQFLGRNYDEKLTLESMAEAVYLTPQYFSRLFKKETGMSFIDYLNKIRIEHACDFLLHSDYPSYRIATECGFSDSSYFTRVFSKHMKCTPVEYRRQSK